MKTAQKYKICRRLGPGVYEKCQTPKFVASAARHDKAKAGKRPKPLSGYGLQFIEKQKVRFMYGISESQFGKYITEAVARKGVVATDYLFELLETRLDNTVYRMGIAHTRRLARQIVSHGHIVVNGKRITVASHHVKVGDTIAIRGGSQKSPLFTDMTKKLKDYNTPNWVAFDTEKLTGTIAGKPANVEGYVDLNTVLEFYSR
jgi:small subunit ribosomal protein S4